jgi:hypothetical protein
MSDIVERLRSWRHDSWPDDPSLDAVEEIERLRARVEHLEREMRFIGRLDYPPTRLSAQNRARAALTALRKLKP